MDRDHQALLSLAIDFVACGGEEAGNRSAQATARVILERNGFDVEFCETGTEQHLFAHRSGVGPALLFLGHTDVVPCGDLQKWTTPPFEPTIRDGYLYGRGTTDMRGAIAAFLTSIEKLADCDPQTRQELVVILAGDEEFRSQGTVAALNLLEERKIQIGACIVGEPSSEVRAGDSVRIGRRGILTGTLSCTGLQGHVAYPERFKNPIHDMLPRLTNLIQHDWPAPAEPWSKASLQVVSFRSGDGTSNTVPGKADILFTIRFPPPHLRDELIETCERLVTPGSTISLSWSKGVDPYFTKESEFRTAVIETLASILGQAPVLSVAGGTSDGRFTAARGIPTLELGPVAKTLHEVDERVRIQDLIDIEEIYVALLNRFPLNRQA